METLRKICFICGQKKTIDMFYKHPQMRHGCLNKCIVCTKLQAKERHHVKNKDEKWVESERARGREKYSRLNYLEKYKDDAKAKWWKNNSIYKGLRRRIKIRRGYELHHWSYQKENLKDVFILNISQHKFVHNHLIFIEEMLCFSTTSGFILDTKEKHLDYLLALGVAIYDKNDPSIKPEKIKSKAI